MDTDKGKNTTTLHALARSGDLEAVKANVSKGEDADRKDCFGRTPLQYASWQGHIQVVEYLLLQNANTEIKDKEGITPLLSATLTGNLQLLDCLLAHGAKTDITDIHGRTPIHLAAHSSKGVPILECLLSHDVNVDISDLKGATPLHTAADAGNIEAVKYLLKVKANTEIKNNNGETALFLATSRGAVEVVKCLVDNGANPEAQNDKEVTCLAVALEADNIELVKILLHTGAKKNTIDKLTKTTPLHVAAKHDDMELIQWLIEKNIDVNARNSNLNTALHMAASRNNVDICKILLSHGGNIEAKNKTGSTPLMVCCMNKCKEVMKYLLDQNANIEARDNAGKTSLHIAAVAGDADLVKMLILCNADIEAEDVQKRTPLHFASYEQCIATVECLLEHDADIEATDGTLNTPLHLCLIQSRNLIKVQVATILVTNGADIQTNNAKLETPFQLAERRNKTDVLRMFKREMQKGLPREMRYLKVDDADSFKKALRSGYYFSYVGKIMIVGNEGVGKTAITSIIVGSRPSKVRKSTEGIDVHISRAAVDLESRKLVSKVLSAEDIAYRNLVMRKKWGRTSEETKLDGTLVNDGVDEQISSDDELESSMASSRNTGTEPESSLVLETKETRDEARAIKDADESVLRKLMKKIKPNKGGKITAAMLKEGTIKAGKKGIHLMKFAPVIILDFAGQRVFYSTHQSFLTHRGLYILTINGSFNLDDEIKTESPIPGKCGKVTTRAYIKFWVSSILTYSKGRNKRFPKILICCTHKDHVPVELLDDQRAFIFNEIAEMFDGTPAMDHLVLHHRICINAMDPEDQEIQVLKDALVDMMFEQPSWGEKIPKSWIHLEMTINKKVAAGKKIIHLKQLEEINKDNPVKILSRNDLDIFLKVHHAQGDIIHFPLPGLRDYIIIYPAFLVNVLRSIVTDKRFCRGKRLDMIESMNQDGILQKSDIDTIWKTNPEIQHHQEYLMKLMSHLDIFAEPRLYNPNTGRLLPSKFYFVPSLITKEDITAYTDQEKLLAKCLGLSFKFHSTVLPPAVAFRFISCCIEMWDVESYDNQRMLFSGMIVVAINKTLTMLVQVKEQRVDIFLLHESSRHQIVQDLASRIRECLNDTLRRISDSYKLSSSGPEAGTESVPFHIEYTCFHVTSPCYTTQITEWVCDNHGDNAGESLKKWIVDRTIDECPPDCKGVVKEALEEVPSELQLSKLVLQISWDDLRSILLNLGMQVNEMKAVEVDYSNNILNIMFICLRKWRIKTRNGTLKEIYTALKESDTNVHALCKVFRDKPLDVPYEVLERDVTDQELDMLATHIIDESLLLSVQLCIDASCWLQMKEDGHKIVNINRFLLRKWRDEHPGKPKMRELAQAFSNVGINIGVFLSEST